MTNKKIVLITGAYRGLGLETARQLLNKDISVILSARDKNKITKAIQCLTIPKDNSIHSLVMDVQSDESIASAVKQVLVWTDHLDVLINNAAIFPNPELGPLDTSRDSLQQAFDVNVAGPLRVSQAFTPLLEKSKDGRIINVSSGLGALAEMKEGWTAYSISKTALNAVTRQLSGVLGPRGISVNSVCPGWCRTELGGANAPRSAEEGAKGIVWLATEAPHSLQGSFVRDQQLIAW